MICQACGIEAPTKNVEFHQNIGALIMRFSKSIKGNLCKSCIHKHYWQFTAINLLLGWWGMISLIFTPIFLINNFVRYMLCLSMEPVPPGATMPELNDAVVARLKPHSQTIITRMNTGESIEKIATDMAPSCGATPGQVLLYMRALIQASRQG